MTTDVVNLRGFRKREKREEKEVAAQVNRAAFARTKSEKDLSNAKRALEKKRLDNHKHKD